MLDTGCFSTFCLRMPHLCSIRFRSGDILGHSITFSSKAVVILAVWFGWLLCIHVSLNEPQLLVPAVVMQPQTTMLPPPCLTVGKAQFSWYSSPGRRPHMLDTIWAKQVYLRLIRPQGMVPVIHALGQVVFSKLFAGFFCEPALEEASFWDDGHANRLVVVCGVWSEHRQAELPLLQP